MLHHAEVVRDKQICQLVFFLQILQQIDNLRLNGNIQRGNRLVADDKFGIQRKRAGNADALALAAGKLVRIAILMERLQA